MNAVGGVDFRRRQVRDNVDAVKQVAGQLFEIFDLADFVHLIDDAVQHRFDFLVRLLLKEWPLAFQPALVAQEFFFVEGRDPLFLALLDFHTKRGL